MPYIREEIRGTSGQDLNKINENFMNIYEKVFGDINFSDVDIDMKRRINTQWIPVQGEGNLDSKCPLYLRFFVPPNVTEVKSTDFNVICENYRMDSSVTSTEESKQEVLSIVSSTAPSSTETSTSEPSRNISSTSSASGVSSVSSANVGVSSLSGGGSTQYVSLWGSAGLQYPAPSKYISTESKAETISGKDGRVRFIYDIGYPDPTLGIPTETTIPYNNGSSLRHSFLDMMMLQHCHQIPAHTHTMSVAPHSHSISMEGHAHEMLIPGHTHDVVIPSHTHEVTGSVTIPAHSHDLNEGIKVSTVQPQGVIIHVNDNPVASIDSSNPTANNIDITDKVKIGDWNIIKITTTNLARVSVYGTLEVLIKNTR